MWASFSTVRNEKHFTSTQSGTILCQRLFLRALVPYNSLELMKESATALSVSQGKLAFKNPVLLASGCASFGEPFEDFFDMPSVGALITKAITREPREGNESPRICETPCGMLNSIGLQNPGVEAFAQEILPELRERGVATIVNVAGGSEQDYEAVLMRLKDEPGIYGFEVNLSCPNVEDGLIFGTSAVAFGRICERLRQATERPLIPKLSPEAGNPVPYAKIAWGAGMDGVTAANTWPAMAIDWKSGKSKLARPTGGLSGPALKPLTMIRVAAIAQAVPELPILASGGAATATDVIEFIRAGALAVQLGTILFHDATRPKKILEELTGLLSELDAGSIQELRGRRGD